MAEHYYTHYRHDPVGEIGGRPGPIQHFKCENCGHQVTLFDNGSHPKDYAMSTCSEKKPSWKSPIKQKAPPEEKRYYPAKPKKRR